MLKRIKNIKNEEFEYEVQDSLGDGVSVLEPGYVITPDGEFILVSKGIEHGAIFSDYINAYLDSQTKIAANNDAMIALTEINHIVYYGLRMRDVVDIYNKGGNEEGVGIIILPENYQEVMSDSQKESLKILLASNKSLFGNYEKMFIRVRETVYGSDLSMEEFKEFLDDDYKIIR